MRRHRLWSRSTVLTPLALAGGLALWSCAGEDATQPNPDPGLPQTNELFVVTEPVAPVASPGQASSFPSLIVEVSYISPSRRGEPRHLPLHPERCR